MAVRRSLSLHTQWTAGGAKTPLVLTSFAATLVLQIIGTYLIMAPQVGFDDANITQVYARHLAEGHGFVYNIGGERVEGSTSLIWTLLNAAAFLTAYRPTVFALSRWSRIATRHRSMSGGQRSSCCLQMASGRRRSCARPASQRPVSGAGRSVSWQPALMACCATRRGRRASRR